MRSLVITSTFIVLMMVLGNYIMSDRPQYPAGAGLQDLGFVLKIKANPPLVS